MKKYYFLASIFVAIILIYFLFTDNKDQIELKEDLKKFKNADTLSKVEILNPTLKSKGLNSKPYEISAKKGVQIDNDLELHEVKGKFTNEKGELLNISADLGFYSQINQTIKLYGNVKLNDEFKNTTTAEIVTISINSRKIELFDNVVTIINNSIIQSNTSTVDKKNGTITYNGNVEVIIDNSQSK